mmetsp:Transcript_5741/g.13056  ORF Transcript_5741/g.13056 Transcript_5741/m.13056 type:complete len:213 (+) Transcript_5741:169-807(+)
MHIREMPIHCSDECVNNMPLRTPSQTPNAFTNFFKSTLFLLLLKSNQRRSTVYTFGGRFVARKSDLGLHLFNHVSDCFIVLIIFIIVLLFSIRKVCAGIHGQRGPSSRCSRNNSLQSGVLPRFVFCDGRGFESLKKGGDHTTASFSKRTLNSVHHTHCTGWVKAYNHIAAVCQTNQGINIRLMGMSRERIYKENKRAKIFHAHERGDLGVSA